ncbi:MAG TPA: 1-(5-phosphoribosyl)-5-[(5-phosphoribosylamino)methylideneamino] imidazole-4-carboxamide isomerase [Flavipsychrobacter sp.]|nr:1-(5-phosphoribosyl)-5-[(5-phosphoribosylamino)methylideneamino] imidazole-4-carboxamide isomerase [Flavipsychrobacter sp.]
MIEIIPAIDIIGGKCVRLSQGDYTSQKIYRESPVEVAKEFEAAGFKRLHIVDLDGARQGRIINIKSLYDIASGTGLFIDYGGGIKSGEGVLSVLNAGAKMISIGSIALQPDVVLEWAKSWGADKIFLGADVNNNMIAINGWAKQTEINISDFIATYYANDIRQVFCTDIAMDGMLQGISSQLYKNLLGSFPELQLVASGGVSCIADIELLQQIGCKGVIIGKAFYEGRIRFDELKQYIN